MDDRSRIWAFDRFSGGAIWRQEDLSQVNLSPPTVYGDYLLVGDSAGYLNWLSVRDGSLQDRVRVGRQAIAEAPLVVNGRIYVLTSGGNLGVYRLAED
nr:PQQ-binding-like beta-propeller repeat protein [Alkalilimnicola ehrlichii]